MPQKI